jgi:PhnB protein
VVERSPDGGEVELRIGDSAIALALGVEFPEGVATRASIYVYVEDADAAYEQALRNGATPASAPEDKPYGERAGGVRDSFGNVWYIATYRGDG